MAVSNLNIIKPLVWIPPIYTANFKITIERKDGTVDDVTDILQTWRFEDMVTDGIGSFKLKFPNPNETYTSIYTGMEIVRYYCDYASTPTTLRFRGRVDKPSSKDNMIELTGRSESLFVIEEKVTLAYSITDAAVILLALFTNYSGGRYVLTDIPVATGIKITVSWTESNFWDCVEEICRASGYDCYIDANLYVKFFEKGTILNRTDAIVEDMNMIEIGDFAPDLTQIRNKIRIYGATVDGVQVFHTANDYPSQYVYGIRRENETNENILTVTQAQEYGDYLLEDIKNPPIIGDVSAVLLATIQPGESLMINSQPNGLIPINYRVIKYVSEMTDDMLKTTVTINKEVIKLNNILKQRIQNESKQQNVITNPYDLDFASPEFFNLDVGTHNNTEITNGVLKKASPVADGVWVSPIITTADGNNVNTIRFESSAEDITGFTLRISTDGGTNYESITRGELKTLTVSIGSKICYEITITSNSTQIDSIVIQYSTNNGGI